MAKIPQIEIDPETGWSEWINISKKLRTICCDCGLAHDDQYKIIDGELWLRTRVNKKSTAAVRRKRRKS